MVGKLHDLGDLLASTAQGIDGLIEYGDITEGERERSKELSSTLLNAANAIRDIAPIEARVAELEAKLAWLRERGYDVDEIAQQARERCKCGHCKYQHGEWRAAIGSRGYPSARAARQMASVDWAKCPKCGDTLGPPANREPQFAKGAGE